MRTNFSKCAALAVLAASGSTLGQTPAPQTFPLRDTTGLINRNVKLEAAEYQGRQAVRLTMEGDGDGFAVLPGVDFQDGIIEADIALKLNDSERSQEPRICWHCVQSAAGCVAL
jgi:hypothetical protein